MANSKQQELETKILKEACFVDIKPYSHNLVSLYLGQLDDLTSTEYVEDFILEYNLHRRGWSVSDEAMERFKQK